MKVPVGLQDALAYGGTTALVLGAPVASVVLLYGLASLGPGQPAWWEVLGITLGSLVFWGFFFWGKITGTMPTTMVGVKKRFDRPVDLIDEGLYFILWPAETMLFFPREELEMEFPPQEVLSGGRLPPAVLRVGVTAYVEFKLLRAALLKAARSIPARVLASQDPDVITYRFLKWMDSAVFGALRRACREVSYEDVFDGPGTLANRIKGLVAETPVFRRAGLGDMLRIEILNVVYPPEVLAAINARATADVNIATTKSNAEAAAAAAEINARGAADAARHAADAARYTTEQQAEAALRTAQRAADGIKANIIAEREGVGLQPGQETAEYDLNKKANPNIRIAGLEKIAEVLASLIQLLKR